MVLSLAILNGRFVSKFVALLLPRLLLQQQQPELEQQLLLLHISHHLIYPLTARVVEASHMISQLVSSILSCSLLPSGTWRTPGLTMTGQERTTKTITTTTTTATTSTTTTHHHLSLKREGRRGTTDDFASSFLHLSLFSISLWDLTNSTPVHSPMLSSHLFFCLPCLLPPFTVPCKMVLARPERETYHCCLRLFTMVMRSSCGPIACWILARTSSLVTWSLYEMRSILR